MCAHVTHLCMLQMSPMCAMCVQDMDHAASVMGKKPTVQVSGSHHTSMASLSGHDWGQTELLHHSKASLEMLPKAHV